MYFALATTRIIFVTEGLATSLPTMLRLYKAIRALVVTLLIIVVAIPTFLYIALSTPWVTQRLKSVAETELTSLLGSKVCIESVHIAPFNRLAIDNASVDDDFGKPALTIQNVSARFEMWQLITSGEIIFDYVEIDGLNASIYKKSADSPINIANIIAKLTKKKPDSKPTKFDLTFNGVKITNSAVSYNVLDAPTKDNTLDINHLSVTDFNLLATLPRISNDTINVMLEGLSFKEKSGLDLTNLSANVLYTPHSLSIDGLTIEMPGSSLAFGSLEAKFDKPDDLKRLGTDTPIFLKIKDGSHITVGDLAFVAPVLTDKQNRFDISLDASGTKNHIDVDNLTLTASNGPTLSLALSGSADNLTDIKQLAIDDVSIDGTVSASAIQTLISTVPNKLNANTRQLLHKIGDFSVKFNGSGMLSDFTTKLTMGSRLGTVKLDGNGGVNSFKPIDLEFDGDISVNELNIGEFAPNTMLGKVSATIDADAEVRGKSGEGSVMATISSLEYRGHTYNNIEAAVVLTADNFTANLATRDDEASIDLDADGSLSKDNPSMNLSARIKDIDPNALGLTDKYQGYRLSTEINGSIAGKYDKWLNGNVNISDLAFLSPDNELPDLKVAKLSVTADNTVYPNTVILESDFINGRMWGDINFKTIVNDVKGIISNVLPAYLSAPMVADESSRPNKFDFEFDISNADNILKFFKSPVLPLSTVTIDGTLNHPEGELLLSVDAPYLLQGNKIIESTAVQARIESPENVGNIYLTTQMPTKKGDLALVTNMSASNNKIDTKISWKIDRKNSIDGEMAFSTILGRDDDIRFSAQVDFEPGIINFGSTAWHIAPAKILYKPRYVKVDDFSLTANDQSISINGVLDGNDDSQMLVGLKNIEMVNIFETLDIDKALIGGIATGTFHASGIFGDTPAIYTDNLHVKNIGYNYCTLGDGEVKAHWDNDKKSFYLDADITEPGGEVSRIWGDIYPANEALDINFDAHRVKVGFLKTFMSAFAQDIYGTASGKARLFGTFKYIDLEGDLIAHDLGIKIDFTNTWYYASNQRVVLNPGEIDIRNVAIRDQYGHTAKLNGYVKHTFFKEPVFDFKITEAKELLCYDTNPTISPIWYGKIYGNGSAFINGEPGVVNIDVNMTTAQNSTFTFVLSDEQIADEYQFITFRDKNRGVINDSIIEVDVIPLAVREYKKRIEQNTDEPSEYNMNIQVDITPDARITLVMDPVGGDEIKGYGSGNLRMTYNMPSNDLRMYGTYTIASGNYTFTLQDIIVKDFNISEGSSIAFTGDPYSARLDIKATYNVNANLSDLDESFLQDKELNRTNVPVHAVLNVTGDMRQPDIAFDLEFPTLTQDTYRKVKSIISTDEMMDRQIVYLLALNRFYTPDYMSTTKGNELFSVASSTISSRISSMLGKISENWSIAPNLRSDRGDFSDIEFDLALSSSLLNNRLRFNGNFGYRDKSLNTNQFIGDFDLEYLLNRPGTWRLKAYNRYNDQNYYLRSAATTQGVGIVFRRDFDNIFGFLRRKQTAAPDTTAAPDSLLLPSLPTDTLIITP